MIKRARYDRGNFKAKIVAFKNEHSICILCEAVLNDFSTKARRGNQWFNLYPRKLWRLSDLTRGKWLLITALTITGVTIYL